MKMQIRFPSQLQKIDYKDLSVMAAISHFVNYGYEYLYIYKNGNLYDVLSYHDFVLFELDRRERSYIVEESEVKEEKIDSFLSNHPEVNRIVVISSGELRYEINIMTEPELLHSIERELFSLRFIDLFLEEISERLMINKRILILAPKHVANFIADRFCNIECDCIFEIDNIPLTNVTDYDAVIDLLCGTKIRKKLLDNRTNVISLYEIIEEIALYKLVEYAKQRDILLRLYRIPDYEQIDSLHPAEINVVNEKIGFIELLKNKDYLSSFCTSDENILFVINRGVSNSLRQDNGIWIIQGDCKAQGINVLRGVRESIPNRKKATCTVHYFGPCIVMGMLVSDEETIPSLFELRCINNNKNVRVENHGGLHGNNVLNSIVGALSTSINSKDVIILFDFFNDLKQEKYENVIDTYDWFNSCKSKEEVYFFDHPVHCNMKGNEVIAENIYKDIEYWLPDFKYFVTEKDLELWENDFWQMYDFSSYFSVSQSIGVKTFVTMLKSVSSEHVIRQSNESNVGALVLFSVESSDWLENKVSFALKFCTQLLLMYSFEHLCQKEQLNNLELCEKYNSYDNVKVIQLGSFFNYFSRCREKERIEEYEKIVEMVESGFIDTVAIPCNLKTRFILSDVNVENFEIANKISYKKSKEAGIDVIWL